MNYTGALAARDYSCCAPSYLCPSSPAGVYALPVRGAPLASSWRPSHGSAGSNNVRLHEWLGAPPPARVREFRAAPCGAHRADRPRRRPLSGSRGGCPPRLPQNRACAVHTRLLGTAGCQPRRRPLSTTSIYPHSSANCSWVEATISSCARRCSSTSDASPRSAKNRGRTALSTCGMWLSAHRDLRPE